MPELLTAPIPTWEILLRLLLAICLGGLIGLERETVEKPAGFRTHMLVSLGAALFTLVSRVGFFGSGADPARVASNIVVGIGFLGAGTIWRSGVTVQGLTTAASLWTVAAIGTATGVGFYEGAVATTALVMAVLIPFKRIERWIPRRGQATVEVLMVDRPGQLGKIGTVLGAFNVNIEHVELSQKLNEHVTMSLAVRLPSRVTKEEVLVALGDVEGVEEVRWKEAAG
ncbi:MAG: MgtC/SapB family protein [Armatimonadota bacterium]|nr:MgtC/SapB family protein [Armatimonadota bacterium]MDR7449314.1 MgtC/SapB family protein [Armatimonadota bacterium]MDR7458761.1 MgtC/SapB family protein [Armatimonadota bacterium]MDR7479979.1 MgtC/SapB family protein [Armatimonadota bacterium]MDR7488631.1 MgtC/SapB family protein [Armatimonadota bacterium]